MKLASFSFLAFALTALAAGCNGASTDPADEEVVGDGSEALTAQSQSTHVDNLALEPISGVDPAKAADEAGSGGSGCVTRAKDPSNPLVVHVTFNDCTGPFGLLHLSGEEVVTFSANEDGSLHAAFASVNLTANGKAITHSATADITIDGSTRHVEWQGGWNMTGANGVAVEHTSDLTIDVDTATLCRTANGTGTTTVGKRGVESTFTDLKVCKNPDGAPACPSGTITHTGKLSKRTVTIAFDGSATAEVTGPGGNTFDAPLTCAAQVTATL